MVSYTKYIGTAGTATLILLIAWFVGSTHFLVEYEGDKTCAGTYLDPCEWKYNITLTTVQTYYIQNKEAIDLVFLPNVKEVYHCKKDGRMTASWRADRDLAPCGIGWREFDWKTPLTSRYKYINKFYKNKKQEFKIVVFKFNPSDVIKFGGEITKEEFDPYFLSVEDYTLIKDCEEATKTEYGTCTKKVVSHIHYDNKSMTEKTIYRNESYRCNPHPVTYQVNCKTIGIKTDKVKINCPEDHRCDLIEEEFCILDCNDGDCNYNAKQNKGKGWSSICVDINNLREETIKISNFKNTFARVEKI